MADNALIDLIRKGYMEDLAKTTRNVGFSGVEGDMINSQADQNVNAMAPLVGGASQTDRWKRLNPNQQLPQNYMIGPSGEMRDLGQSAKRITMYGKPAYLDPNGQDISIMLDTGGTYHTTVAEQNAIAEQERRNAELADLPRRKALADIAEKEAQAKKLEAEATGKTNEPAPKAKPDTRMFKNAQGEWEAQVIPGTSTYQTLKSKEADDRGVLQNTVPMLGKNAEQIDTLLTSPGFDSIFGLVASRTPNVMPNARAAQAQLEQVIGAMQTTGMQLQRSTAGSAGSMTEKEWPKMEAYLNQVKQATDPETARNALKMAQLSYKRMQDVAKEHYQNEWANSQFGDKTAVERLNAPSEKPNSYSRQNLPPVNAEGWVLHTDKNGAMAYVGPNGQIKEVK